MSEAQPCACREKCIQTLAFHEASRVQNSANTVDQYHELFRHKGLNGMQAVSKLQALDKSFTVLPDPKKVKTKKGVTFYVNSVPRELDMNLHDVLGLAKDSGYVTLEQLAAKPSWTHRRAELVLEAMIKDGTCLIDDGASDGIRLFWFPSSAGGMDV